MFKRYRAMLLAAGLGAALFFGSTVPGAAQEPASEAPARSHTAGLVLNLHLQGGSLATEESSNSGGGAGVMIGYGVSRKVLIFVQLDGSEIDIDGADDLQGSYGLVHGDLGVRYSFANPDGAFVPYLTGAFTGLWAGAEVLGADVTLQGGGVRLGGGFGYYFIRQLALDVGLSFNFGSFNTFKIENTSFDLDNPKANSTRLEVGLSWYPQG